METNNTISAGVNTAFNEQAILAHMRLLRVTSGVKGLRLKITSAYDDLVCCVATADGQSACVFGKTFAEAIERIRPLIQSPAELATEKRKQAAQLENEAALLELQAINRK